MKKHMLLLTMLGVAAYVYRDQVKAVAKKLVDRVRTQPLEDTAEDLVKAGTAVGAL